MAGQTTFTVTDKRTDETFEYKRYHPSAAYSMKREGETKFTRIKKGLFMTAFRKSGMRV